MKTIICIAAFVLAVGCVPTPQGTEVDASEASALILKLYRNVSKAPPVFIVPSDGCKVGTGQLGFMDPNKGECALAEYAYTAGFQSEIYLVDSPEHRFSSYKNLPHELAHFIGYEHPGEPFWRDDEPIGKIVKEATDALSTNPADVYTINP